MNKLFESVCTEGKRRSLDELLVSFQSFCIHHIIDEGISLCNNLIIIVPCIVVVDRFLLEVHNLIVDVSPTRSIVVVVVVLAWKVLIQTYDGILTSKSLTICTMLNSHSLCHTIQCLIGILSSSHRSLIADRLRRVCVKIVAGTRCKHE